MKDPTFAFHLFSVFRMIRIRNWVGFSKPTTLSFLGQPTCYAEYESLNSKETASDRNGIPKS